MDSGEQLWTVMRWLIVPPLRYKILLFLVCCALLGGSFVFAALGDPAIKWARIYDNPQRTLDTAQGIALDSLGNVYVAGYYDKGTSVIDRFGGEIIKYSSSGLFMWRNVFATSVSIWASGAQVFGHTIAVNSNNELYAAAPRSNFSIVVLKTSSSGVKIWESVYSSSTTDEEPNAVALDTAGDVYATGPTCIRTCGSGGNNSNFRTVKYASSSGAIIWNNVYTVPTVHDYSRGVAVDPAKNIYVTGEGGAAQSFLTLKYASSGNPTPLWTKTESPSPGTNYNYSTDVAVDPRTGFVYIAGYTTANGNYGVATSTGFRILKYSSTTGAAAPGWPAGGAITNTGGDDRAYAITLDVNGDAYAAGVTPGLIGKNFDVRINKYTSSTGALLWTRVFDSGKDYNDAFRINSIQYDADRPVDIAVDATGTIYIAGHYVTSSNAQSADIFTVVFQRFNGAGPACYLYLNASSTNWTDNIQSTNRMRKVHVNELRAWINNQRQDVGLFSYSWTDPTIVINQTKVRAVHFTEMRQAVSDVYSACGAAPPTFSSPITTNTRTSVSHTTELRNVIQNAP